MIVAITGGTGFIGSQLVKHHLQQGDVVRLLSRKTSLKNLKVNCFLGDLSDVNVDLFDFVKDVDILYHCAGEVTNESLMYDLHIRGTRRLVDMAEGKIRRWVQLSSVGAYGACRAGIITENSEEQPNGIYEYTKTQSDAIVISSGIPYVILRPSKVIGMHIANKSVSDLYQLINLIKKGMFFYIGKKGALVNYIAVDDVVNALFLCGNSKSALGKIYNLSQTTSLEKMVSSFSTVLGVNDNFLRLPETPIRILTKIFEIFPKFPLTTNRINGLTSRYTYNSNKIIKDLDFKFNNTLEEYFKLIASKK